MDYDLISYQFSRQKIERGDFKHFLTLYRPDQLPDGRRLRELMNTFVFCIEGWDGRPKGNPHDSRNPTVLFRVPFCLAVLALFLQPGN
jgi:hypothetical protein